MSTATPLERHFYKAVEISLQDLSRQGEGIKGDFLRDLIKGVGGGGAGSGISGLGTGVTVPGQGVTPLLQGFSLPSLGIQPNLLTQLAANLKSGGLGCVYFLTMHSIMLLLLLSVSLSKG